MPDCQFQSRVEAYHDGELSAEGRRAVEEHLETCEDCAAEMAWLRSVSQSMGRGDSEGALELTTAELGRVHAAVDDAMDEVAIAETDSYPISLYRAAGALMAIAASVLIVSCVWLSELPTPAGPRQPIGVAANPVEGPAWERVAMTLRADPLPTGLDSEPYLADARVADWVLRGLGAAPGGRRDPNPAQRPAHEGP
jgi:anti-sigma factor RsiW